MLEWVEDGMQEENIEYRNAVVFATGYLIGQVSKETGDVVDLKGLEEDLKRDVGEESICNRKVDYKGVLAYIVNYILGGVYFTKSEEKAVKIEESLNGMCTKLFGIYITEIITYR